MEYGAEITAAHPLWKVMYMSFDALRKKRAVEILIALASEAKGIREIQKAIGGSFSTISARLKELQKEDLVKEEYPTGTECVVTRSERRLIRLTEKGRRLIQSMIHSGFVRPILLPKFRQRWIIAVLHTLGMVSGRTRFTKLLFLLENESGLTKSELAGFYQFRAGKYGPSSRGVIEDLEELKDYGFIKVEVKSVLADEFNDGLKFLHTYELVREQSDVVREAIDNLPSNVLQRLDKLRSFNNMSLIELLKYIYTNYPNYVKKPIIVEGVLRSRSIT